MTSLALFDPKGVTMWCRKTKRNTDEQLYQKQQATFNPTS